MKTNEIYFAYYSYTLVGQRTPLEGKASLAGHKEYETATAGKAVMVLYDSEKSKRSTMYEYGGYAWE